MLTQEGMSIRVNVGDIRVISRNTQGVRLINLKQNDKIVAVARMEEKEEDKEVAEGEEVAGEEEAVEENGGEEATTEEATDEDADK